MKQPTTVATAEAITQGVAKAMMRYNVRDVGEEVTVRSCHSYFIPVGKTTITS